MSVLGEYPDVQIWTNSAFDDDNDSEPFNSFNSYNRNNQIKSPSTLTKKPIPVNLSSDSSKENQSPVALSKSSVPVHQSKPLKTHSLKPNFVQNVEKSDEEIAIENEICRLYAKLESIRAEKTEKSVKKKEPIQESRNKIQRRGFSLGPNEIMNLKPKQWGSGSGLGSIQSTQNRRKSCFWKLDDIQEERNPSVRKAVTTVGLKKGVKKDDSVLATIQPKKLFGEPEVVKKAVKPGRVVPSRYNQATVNSSMKKRSFTEPKPRGGMEGRVKKKWDIPSAIVIPKRLDLDEGECEGEERDRVVVVMAEVVVLPRIRVGRCVEEAGRDSGPAKRVAELVGKKSYFDEEAVCQTLRFDED